MLYNLEKYLNRVNINNNLILTGLVKQKIDAYKNANMIFAIGGGYLLTNTPLRKIDRLIGRPQIYFNCLEFFFAKAYKKPVILLHQSIGPFSNLSDLRHTIKYLKKVDLIVTREQYSFKLVKKYCPDITILRPDLAFSFNKSGVSYFSSNKMPTAQIKIGITVRFCLNSKEQSIYERELASFITRFLTKNQNAEFYFMPQVIYKDRYDDDTLTAKRISSMVKEDLQKKCFCIEIDFSPQDLKATIGQFDYFIGTRMHSNIFALCNLVKTIAIAYEPKTNGIMDMLNLQNYTVNADKLKSDFLIKTMSRLDNDVNYKDRLRNKIEYLTKETWEF